MLGSWADCRVTQPFYLIIHLPRSLPYWFLISVGVAYLMLLMMDFCTDLSSWNLISGFPTTVVRKRPDVVRTGAPYPGLPNDKAS